MNYSSWKSLKFMITTLYTRTWRRWPVACSENWSFVSDESLSRYYFLENERHTLNCLKHIWKKAHNSRWIASFFLNIFKKKKTHNSWWIALKHISKRHKFPGIIPQNIFGNKNEQVKKVFQRTNVVRIGIIISLKSHIIHQTYSQNCFYNFALPCLL